MNGHWGCVHFCGGLVFLPIDISWTVPTNHLVKELGARTDCSTYSRVDLNPDLLKGVGFLYYKVRYVHNKRSEMNEGRQGFQAL